VNFFHLDKLFGNFIYCSALGQLCLFILWKKNKEKFFCCWANGRWKQKFCKYINKIIVGELNWSVKRWKGLLLNILFFLISKEIIFNFKHQLRMNLIRSLIFPSKKKSSTKLCWIFDWTVELKFIWKFTS
jgi:hypothetical protein